MSQMHTEPSEQPHEPVMRSSWSQRRRVKTIDLMQGARGITLLHEGEEYVLHITKAGKLVLTK